MAEQKDQLNMLSMLAALGAATCPQPVPTSPDTTERTPCLPVLSHRMLRDQTQQERSKAPMDALALLCVSEPQKQVVAIGCQVDYPPDAHDSAQLHFTVSSNTMTPQLQSIEPYIRRLWTVMQQISRIRGQERCTLTSPMYQSPPHTPYKSQISHLILKLNIIAFKYTFRKLYFRFRKRYHSFLAFRRYLLTTGAESLATSSRAARILPIILQISRQIVELAENVAPVVEVVRADKDITDAFAIPVINNLQAIAKLYHQIEDRDVVDLLVSLVGSVGR